MKPNRDELPLESLIGKPIAVYCDGKLIRSFQDDPQKTKSSAIAASDKTIEKDGGKSDETQI